MTQLLPKFSNLSVAIADAVAVEMHSHGIRPPTVIDFDSVDSRGAHHNS